MTTRSNRRNFIQRASLLPLAAAAGTGGGVLSAVAGNAPAGNRDEDRRGGLKVSLNGYCFNTSLLPAAGGGKPAMTLFDVLDFCAKYNFDAIDPTGYYFPGYPQVPPDSFLYDFKRHAFKLGVAISGTGIRNNFASPDQAQRAADVQLVKDWIDVAAKLGAPVIRVFAGAEPAGHTRDEVDAWMAADLKQCVEHGRQHGVLVGIQNHGDYLKTADQVLRIIKLVDSDWFGAIVDTGNFQSQDPYAEIAKVVPAAVNFQVKESPYGRASAVRMDVNRLVQVVRAGGYRGYLPIETLVTPNQPYNPLVTVPRFLQEVRSAIDQNG